MVYASKTILAVGSHPDDIELGCGGTLYQAAKQGAKIVAVFMTKGELSASPGVRMQESIKALSILGVTEVHFGDFPDSEIPQSRKSIDFLESFAIKHNPDIVLTHTTNDVHQDHRQTGWISISAFRNVPKILAYETPRVTPNYSPNYFIDISNATDLKWKALQCHMSQKTKRYLAYESMVNLASFRGSQVGLAAAEGFEVVKFVETAAFGSP
jgi:LmbE family N-acetylglucosaminyl deacetylase